MFAGIDVSASYVWLEGLTLRDQPYALMSKNAPTGVVISRCAFFNNHYSIYLQRGGSYWYIADNTIVGDTPYSTESLDGEGIELNGYSVESFGHVVAHNRISNVADGISNGTYNIDVFGNDIFDVVRRWLRRRSGRDEHPRVGKPHPQRRPQRHQLPASEQLALVHPPESARGIHGSAVQVQDDRSIGHRPQHDRDVEHDVLLQRRAPAAIDRQEQPVGVGRPAGGSGTSGRPCGTGARDFNNNGFDWGTSTSPFRYGGVLYSSLAALRGGVRPRDERTADQSNDLFREASTCLARRPCRFRRST